MQLTSCQEESLSGSDLAKVARTNLIGLLERTDSLAKADQDLFHLACLGMTRLETLKI